MKYAVLTVFAIFGATLCRAKTYNIPALAEALPPVSEIVTNVVISIDTQKLESFCMSMSFTSCASNELMLAIGHDADADGDLSFDEAALVFGCDCGGWYRVDAATGGVMAGGLGETLEIGKGDFGDGWDTVKILHRGLGVFAETVTQDAERRKLIIRFR